MKKLLKIAGIIFAGVFVLALLIALIPGGEEAPEEVHTDLQQTNQALQDEISDRTSTEVSNISLKVKIFDDTEATNLDDFELWTRGKGSWYPDTGFGADLTTIGPYSPGDTVEIYLYPSGRDGKEIIFSISVTEETLTESDRDTIIIEVSDTAVEVTSTGLEGITREFSRF
jgi:hypothetical protein